MGKGIFSLLKHKKIFKNFSAFKVSIFPVWDHLCPVFLCSFTNGGFHEFKIGSPIFIGAYVEAVFKMIYAVFQPALAWLYYFKSRSRFRSINKTVFLGHCAGRPNYDIFLRFGFIYKSAKGFICFMVNLFILGYRGPEDMAVYFKGPQGRILHGIEDGFIVI